MSKSEKEDPQLVQVKRLFTPLGLVFLQASINHTKREKNEDPITKVQEYMKEIGLSNSQAITLCAYVLTSAMPEDGEMLDVLESHVKELTEPGNESRN